MKPFNKDSTCPKCNGDDVRSYYRPAANEDVSWYERMHGEKKKWPQTELIERSCRRCSYSWPEDVCESDLASQDT